MRFDTLIRGGTIVTASDTYVSDVGIVGGKISTIGLNLPEENAGKVIDARGMLVMPGGIDVHTHLDMPFGGTTSADDFEIGHDRGGLRRDDHADRFRDSVQGPEPAAGVRHVDEEGRPQGGDRLRLSLHHHRSRRRATRRDGRADPRRRLELQTVHGLSGRVDGGRRHNFRAMSQAAKYGGLICMHAENGGVIDVIVQRALAEGKTRAEVSRARRAPRRPKAEATGARHRAGGDGGRARVHRASFVQRRARKSARGARPRVARVRGDLPAVSLSLARKYGRAGIRRREVRFHAAAAREVAPGKIVAGT